MLFVKFCECCANNEIVLWCDVVVGHVGGAVGRGGGRSAGGGFAPGARAESAR